MSSEDFVKLYKNKLSPYEREEVYDFDVVYYAHLTMKNKGIGQYVSNELTCQDEASDSGQPTSEVYNHGFDNEDADFLYEQKDQINYRYEV